MERKARIAQTKVDYAKYKGQKVTHMFDGVAYPGIVVGYTDTSLIVYMLSSSSNYNTWSEPSNVSAKIDYTLIPGSDKDAQFLYIETYNLK